MNRFSFVIHPMELRRDAARKYPILGLRPERAVEQFRAALTIDAQNPHAHALMALALTDCRRLEAARHEAELALQGFPDGAFYHYVLGVVLGASHRWKEAQNALENAIALDPDEAAYHARLAWIFVGQEKWREAGQSAGLSLALDPDEAGAHLCLGYSLLQTGQKEAAKAHFERAVALEPENEQAHNALGLYFARTGQAERGLEHVTEALRLNPEARNIHENMAETLGAKSWFYGLLWRWNLWMSKFSSTTRLGIILGLWAGMQLLDSFADSHPSWAPTVGVIRWIYLAFCLYTWTAPGIFRWWLKRRQAL